MQMTPLAELLRPTKLSEVIGQDEVVGKDRIINQMVASGKPSSLIFWGPPGTGKTTLARILAHEFKADFIELSAVTASKKDVVKVVEQAQFNRNLGKQTILFVDEIHRFNKAQQDAFLPHVESGLITLFGATTENPSFEVIAPLMSRTKLVVLKQLDKKSMIKLLKHALKTLKSNKLVESRALDYIAELAAGDARSALNKLELALQTLPEVTLEKVKTLDPNTLVRYDKKGDSHYDIISAFIKSMRGSDVTATTYYLARMLKAGEDPKFIARRMIIFASEDIGLAGNGALALANATFEAVHKTGLPEARIPLFHCAVALAKSKKSRESYDLMLEAEALAEKFPNASIPLHVRNAPTKLMKDLGYGKNYHWQADFKHPDGFLPDVVKEALKK